MGKRYNISKEELKEKIIEESIKLGKSLTDRDLSKYNLPYKKVIYRIFDCKTWNDVLSECGLTLNKVRYKNYSNEDLLEILRKQSIELGRSPTSKDLGKKYNLPSSEVYYTRFKTESWNKILGLANLEITHFQQYSKECCLEILKDLYKKLGRIPKRSDFEELKVKPSLHVYNDLFGGIINASVEAGLIEKPLTDEERIEISINELRQLSDNLNRCPSVEEYEKYKNKGFDRRTLERKLKMKYNDICRKYNDKYEIHFAYGEITQEHVINALTDVKNKLGRPPMFYELKNFGYIYSYETCSRVFKGLSYNNIIKSLGWTPTGSTTCVKTVDILLEEFYELFKKIKRIPYYNDLNNNSITSSAPTYSKYFKYIKNICDLLNIDYDLYYQNAGSGKICLDENGDICKSYVEKDITNYFIHNNIEYEKETKYSEIIEYMRKRFDWKIKLNGKWYYVEYFGLYDKNPRGSLGRKYFKRTNYKIKKLYQYGYIENCIFIFPYDIKTKTLDEIFKPYLNININVS